MKKNVLPCLIIMLCCTLVQAQESFVQPPAKRITSFPFIQLTGGIMIVRAQFGSIPDTLNFILDTGCGGISLDSTTAANYKIATEPSDRTIRGIAGVKTISFINRSTLILPGLRVDSLNFHVNDYDLLTSVYGIKIDGIIGYSFLRRFIVGIDYDKQEVTVYEPGTFKYPRGGYIVKPAFTTLPIPEVVIEDGVKVNSRFIFDTGAGLCFMLTKRFVRDSSFLRKKTRLYTTQAEGVGGKKLMDMTVMKSLSFGPYKFRKVPVYIFEDEYNLTSYPSMSGIFGNDILRRFNVVLNYPAQSIYIKPNTHYNDAFDYSYTGLGIYIVDGEIKVMDIMKGSPGDKAGFQSGDVILAVGNNFSKNIQVYKLLMQNTEGKIRVLVMRNGNPIVINLNVKNILH